MAKDPLMKIDKQHFVIKLYEDLLEVDLKERMKKELEDIVEARPILRESLGMLFQTIIPLDVALSSIDSVEVGDNGKLRIVIPLRRDINIPLDVAESEKLAEKLNELIPLAKMKEAENVSRLEEADKRPRPGPREPM